MSESDILCGDTTSKNMQFQQQGICTKCIQLSIL